MHVALLVALCISAGCATAPPPREAAKTVPPVPHAAAAPLRLVESEPVEGGEIQPAQRLRLTFDRAVDLRYATREALQLEYVASSRRFLTDPFVPLDFKLEPGSAGRVLVIGGADFLPGETVRLTLTGALRAEDGGSIGTGAPLVLTFHVPELPPP